MYALLRPLLFQLAPETAHNLTLNQLRRWRPLVRWLYGNRVTAPHQVMGLTFPNRVGLAAGLDKNGECIDGLAALGFGFIEIGTVTPRPQTGNPHPRLFRLPEKRAIINRMGFNNRGVEYVVKQLKQRQFNGILGINIGKNATTPLENALDDYLTCLDYVYPYADYVAINISSPNTANLRQLQHGQALQQLLHVLKQHQAQLHTQHGKYVPLVVKIAPDLDALELQALAETLITEGIDGVIATNTTLSRDTVHGLPHAQETGGLSGCPLFGMSTVVVAQLAKYLQGKVPIIAVGGIMSVEDAQAKIAVGAALVQIYTGLIYRGPSLVNAIARGLAES